MLGDFPHLQAPEGYVFIVTYGRSGSTLLQHLLNSLPGYCIRGENNDALKPLFQSVHRLCNGPGPRPGGAEGGKTSDPTHPWFGIEGINADRYSAALADTFVREILGLPEGTRVGGFKEIRYGAAGPIYPYLNFMANTFPGARFIFDTRDHAEVARSGWWAKKDPAQVHTMLENQERLYRAYMAAHPDTTLHLHYNDYVKDRDEFRRLFDFVGEPYDPGLIAQVMDEKLTHGRRGAGKRAEAGPFQPE